MTFRADELEKPISDTRGGAVIYHGRLGGSSGTAKSDLCDPTSSSTTATSVDIDEESESRRPASYCRAIASLLTPLAKPLRKMIELSYS